MHLLNIDAYQLRLNIKMKENINFKLQNYKPNKHFFKCFACLQRIVGKE